MNKLAHWLHSLSRVKKRSPRIKGATGTVKRKHSSESASCKKYNIKETDFEFLYVQFNGEKIVYAPSSACDRTSDPEDCDNKYEVSQQREPCPDYGEFPKHPFKEKRKRSVRRKADPYTCPKKDFSSTASFPTSGTDVLDSCAIQEVDVPEGSQTPTSCSSRSLIRTNPWLRPPLQNKGSQTPTVEIKSISPDQTVNRPCEEQRCYSKALILLEESFSSSGYGTHDSSPEMSLYAPSLGRPSRAAFSHHASISSGVSVVSDFTGTFTGKTTTCHVESLIDDENLKRANCDSTMVLASHAHDRLAGSISSAEPMEISANTSTSPDLRQNPSHKNHTRSHVMARSRRPEYSTTDLTSKLYNLQQMKCSVQRIVDKAKADHEEIARNRHYYQEQLRLVNELKLVVRGNCEPVVSAKPFCKKA